MQRMNVTEILGAREQASRVSTALDKLRTPKTESMTVAGLAPSIKGFFQDLNATRPSDIPLGIGTLAGGAAGYYFMRGKHPLLGTIAGLSAGTNLPALTNDNLRKPALGNMLQTGAAITGSMYMPKHRVIGFLLGWIGGGIAAHVSGLKK